MLDEAIKKIEVWGDSLLKGIVYDPQRKKYTRLEESNAVFSLEEMGLTIKNNAHFGMTAPKARKLMEKALEKGVDCQYAVIVFGGNYCDFNWREVAANPGGEHFPNTTLEEFKNCITDMVNLTRKKGITPVLVNLPPIDPRRYFTWISRGLNARNIITWLGDVQHIYRFHEGYSLAIMTLANKLGCELIDVRQPFLAQKQYCRFLCEDGIHPNQEGHLLMKKAFNAFAMEKL